MAKKKSSKKPVKPIRISEFFGRYHVLLFTLVVGGGLSFIAYMLLMIVNNSTPSDDFMPPSASSSFDTQTIERIETLRPLNETPPNPDMPSGRTDPFPQ